jgi:hypothetical protein
MAFDSSTESVNCWFGYFSGESPERTSAFVS